jgi:hypothetical protein
VAEQLDCLLSKHEALSSNPSATKKKKREKMKKKSDQLPNHRFHLLIATKQPTPKFGGLE